MEAPGHYKTDCGFSETSFMDSSGAQGTQPPPGYPSDSGPQKNRTANPRIKKKGERGFIEGCLAALCCCWLCETCF